MDLAYLKKHHPEMTEFHLCKTLCAQDMITMRQADAKVTSAFSMPSTPPSAFTHLRPLCRFTSWSFGTVHGTKQEAAAS